jgi:hypothetical protein
MAANNNPELNLRIVGKFPSSPEAELARSILQSQGIPSRVQQGELVTTLSYLGTALGDVRLAVAERDAPRALAILRELRDRAAQAELEDDDWDDELPVYGEGGYADDDDDEEERVAPPLNPELVRAYRAAIIGLLVLPPVINFYSLWIIARNRLWREENWRFPVAILVNILGGFVGGMVMRAFGVGSFLL